MKYRCLWAWAACLSAGLAGGCATPAPRPPQNLDELVRQPRNPLRAFRPQTIAMYNVRRVLSPALSPEDRLASMRVVETLAADMPEAHDALAGVLTEEGAPPPLRNEVLEFLARRRHPAVGRHVAEALPLATDPGVRDAILKWLEENPSPGVLSELVKLWASQGKTTDREEACYRRIVSKATAQPWDEALLGRLNEEESFPRGSALEVLSARVSPTVLRQRVAAMEAKTPGVRAMQRMIKDFNVLPSTRQELLATVVAVDRSPAGLPGAAQLAGQWQSTSGYRFNIRDLHLLEQISSDPLRDARMSRQQLALEISRDIARRRGSGDRPALRSGRLVDFDAQAEILSMADLWNLLLLKEAFGHRSTMMALAVVEREDRADRTSRSGGLIAYEHGWAAPKLYLPGEKRGDDQYVPSERFLGDAMGSICFFVGHFSRPSDPAKAGPDGKELDLAATHNLYGVVLTSLSGNALNATYFTPRGVQVDLGEFATRR